MPDSGCLIVNIVSVNNPIFGQQELTLQDCAGLAFDMPQTHVGNVEFRLTGKVIPLEKICRQEATYWVAP
jgi:hypothetical protein